MQHNIYYRTFTPLEKSAYRGFTRTGLNRSFMVLVMMGYWLLLTASGCYKVPNSRPDERYVQNALRVLDENPWNDNAPVRSFLLNSNGTSSIHLIQVRKEVKPHYHGSHDETVYVIEGYGLLRIGDITWEVKAGHVIYIPALAHHSFVNLANQPTTVISVYNPPFDGQDRVPIEWPAQKK